MGMTVVLGRLTARPSPGRLITPATLRHALNRRYTQLLYSMVSRSFAHTCTELQTRDRCQQVPSGIFSHMHVEVESCSKEKAVNFCDDLHFGPVMRLFDIELLNRSGTLLHLLEDQN
jgi:hypothetical protein